MGSDKSRIARRDFLTSVGRAVGSAAMLRTMTAMGIGVTASACGSSSANNSAPNPAPPAPSPPPPGMQSPRPGDWDANIGIGKSVVILGAGIAGMTAAWEMAKLGYTCTIIEATSRAGGRNRTIRGGDVITETDSSQVCTFDIDADLYFNPGPARISHHHEFLLGYCREFGIALETFVNENHAALLHSTASFGGVPVLARRLHADTRGNVAELLSTAVNQGALDQELTATDKTNILTMLQQYGDLDASSVYVGSERAGFPGQENTGSRQRGELVNSLQLQELLADTFLQLRQDFAQGLDQQPTMLQPVGGMDQIALAFESRVAANIIYDAEVVEIRKITGGARVIYRDPFATSFTVDADYCICTIPATVLRDIPNDFSVNHQAEITAFTYSSAGKTAFQSRRFWEQDHNIYGGISWTNQDITQLWYPNNGFGQTNGIIVGAYIFGGVAGDNFAAQTPAERITTGSNEGANLHAGYATEVARGISVAWSKIPFQLGAWGNSNPGVLLTADDNIFFAGEHLSILQGWQEGAILSAYHAIDLIAQRDTP